MLPSLFFWVIILFIVWRSEKNKSDARFILLPEGIILCDRWSNEQKRNIKSIAYADVETMELKVMGGTFAFPVAQVRDMSVEEYIEHVQLGVFTFDIVYQGGKKEQWTIPLKYYTQAEETRLVARIVTDYAAFVHHYKFKF